MRAFKTIGKCLIGIFIVVGVWVVVKDHAAGLKAFTPASLRDRIQNFGALGPLIYVLAYALNTISMVPPITVISLAGGLAFGQVLGAFYLMVGMLFGTSCTFFLSRLFGRAAMEKALKGRWKDVDDMLQRGGFFAVLFLRVIPLIPHEVLNYACGLSKIKFRDYIVATFLGSIPSVAIWAFFGSELDDIKRVRDIFSLKYLIAVTVLGVIVVVSVVYRYVRTRIDRRKR